MCKTDNTNMYSKNIFTINKTGFYLQEARIVSKFLETTNLSPFIISVKNILFFNGEIFRTDLFLFYGT